MKNALALKIGGFTALVSTSVLGSVTAASADNVDGCGLEPVGGTLVNNAGICELTFDSAGTHNWNLPAGIAGLHGVLVGGGGGASYAQPNDGYAGEGGDVEFQDFTSRVAGDTFTVAVGAGGNSVTTGSGNEGDDSSVLVNGGGGVVALGGDGAGPYTMVWGYCGSIGALGEHTGAGTPGGPGTGGPCVGGGPGIIPDTAIGAPAIFDGFTAELGHGGGVYIDVAHTPRIGEGANVLISTNGTVGGGDDVSDADDSGADGAVVFRYTAADANNVSGSGSGSGSGSETDGSLATTGGALPVAAFALASVAIIAAGVGLRAIGRRRSRTSR